MGSMRGPMCLPCKVRSRETRMTESFSVIGLKSTCGGGGNCYCGDQFCSCQHLILISQIPKIDPPRASYLLKLCNSGQQTPPYDG